MTNDGELLVLALPVLDDPDGRQLRIDRADKHVLFSQEMLAEIREAAMPDATVVDGVLRIVGINRTVAYRLDVGGDAAAGVRAERVDEE